MYLSKSIAGADVVNGDIENILKQKFEVGINTHKLWSKAIEGDYRCFKTPRYWMIDEWALRDLSK